MFWLSNKQHVSFKISPTQNIQCDNLTSRSYNTLLINNVNVYKKIEKI